MMRLDLRTGNVFAHAVLATSFLLWAGSQSVYGQAATAPAAAAASPAGDAKPVATVDEPIHDFGSNWVGGTLDHTFKIRNTGNADLEILQVRPACGCTVVGQHPKVIKPGETGEFPVRLNTASVHNVYSKSIAITTNDPAKPQVMLAVKGEVKRHIDIIPTAANFGAVYGDKPQTRTLKITNRMDKKLKLALDPYMTEAGPFRFELKEVEPGKAFELVVTTVPPYEVPSNQKTTATILTNVEELRQLNIIAMANIQGRLAVVPKELLIVTPTSQPADKPPTTFRQYVRLSNNGDTPVKVTGATVDDPAITTTVEERSGGKLYIIVIEPQAGYVVPDEGRKLTIRTDDAEQPVIEVPIRKRPTTPPARTAQQQTTPSPTPTPAPTRLRPAEKLVGTKAPVFDLRTFGGKSVSSESFKGSIAVLDFFAPNCGFCKKQMPRLEALRADYESKGVRFLYVQETMRKPFTQEEVVQVLSGIGVKGEVAVDPENAVGKQFQANGFPTMVIVGKGGAIEAVNVGNRADLEPRVKAQLDALLEGKPIPAEHLPPKESETAGG